MYRVLNGRTVFSPCVLILALRQATVFSRVACSHYNARRTACTRHNVLSGCMYSKQCSLGRHVLTTMFSLESCTHHNVLSSGIHVVDVAGDDDGALLQRRQAGVSNVREAYPEHRENALI